MHDFKRGTVPNPSWLGPRRVVAYIAGNGHKMAQVATASVLRRIESRDISEGIWSQHIWCLISTQLCSFHSREDSRLKESCVHSKVLECDSLYSCFWIIWALRPWQGYLLSCSGQLLYFKSIANLSWVTYFISTLFMQVLYSLTEWGTQNQ